MGDDIAPSNDAELAEYYYDNRDSLMGEEADVLVAERLESVVSVRFTPSELDAVKRAADAAGLKLSAYIRQAALSTASVVDLDRARKDIRRLEHLVSDLSGGPWSRGLKRGR
jgi:uncharacterized protein (DUF1778 family)